MHHRISLIVSIVFLIAVIIVHIYVSFLQNNEFVYALDDAYIHMGISKNLAQHGVWGITKYEFSSSSSSPLYTLLLAGLFVLFGVSSWIPLLVNGLVAIALIFLMYRICNHFLSAKVTLVFLLSFILILPLPAMVVSGMEHTLQIFLCILFLGLSYKQFTGEKVNLWVYFAVACAAVMTRYEDVFVIGLVALTQLVVYRKKMVFGMLILAIVLPIVGYGLYSLSKGSFFFPNSLLVKANLANRSVFYFITSLLKKIEETSLFYALIFALTPPFILFPFKTWDEFKKNPVCQIALVIILATTAHLLLAKFGWFFRYEAYLVGATFFCMIIYLKKLQISWSTATTLKKALATALCAIFLFPVLFRIHAIAYTNIAMKNIHDQQIMMARLLQKYYPNTAVAANDIGAIAFYNDAPVLDMMGLGSVEVLKVDDASKAALFHQLAQKKGVKLALFYERWFPNVPDHWVNVGQWSLTDNYICGNSTVSIFAIDTDKDQLIRNLQHFSSQLPSNIVQSGLYTNEACCQDVSYHAD